MHDGLLKLVVAALGVGALLIFAAIQLIGTEANKGRLAQMADQGPQPIAQSAPMAQPLPQVMPEPPADSVPVDDEWYGGEQDEDTFAPEPFDPSPQANDLPAEDLRFNPAPEPGMGQPQIVEPGE